MFDVFPSRMYIGGIRGIFGIFANLRGGGSTVFARLRECEREAILYRCSAICGIYI